MGEIANRGRERTVSAPVTAVENRYARAPMRPWRRRWPWRCADFARAGVATSVGVQPARFRVTAMCKIGPNAEIGPRRTRRTVAAVTRIFTYVFLDLSMVGGPIWWLWVGEISARFYVGIPSTRAAKFGRN